MVGFTPNDAPFEPNDKETEIDFEALWDERLDISSSEVQEAYERYDRAFRR